MKPYNSGGLYARREQRWNNRRAKTGIKPVSIEIRNQKRHEVSTSCLLHCDILGYLSPIVSLSFRRRCMSGTRRYTSHRHQQAPL